MVKYLKKHWWETIFTCLLMVGFASGIAGFMESGETQQTPGNSLYETFRLFERKYHSKDIPPALMVAQWSLFLAFLWLTLKIIITIIAPNLLSDLWVRLFYRKHIVICGLNEITLHLADEHADKKILVLAEEYNKYAESLKIKGVKLLFCGDPADEEVLRKAKIHAASRVYAVTNDDKKNVEITRSVSSSLNQAKTGGASATDSRLSGAETRRRRSDALKCYTLIKDRELKILLEESALFKYGTSVFDPNLFHVNEIGIKYGLNMNIDKILPEMPELSPHFLVVGLTDKAAMLLLNLAHGLTTKRDVFQFTVVEKDSEKIRRFREKQAYLTDFARMEYVENEEEICKTNRFSAVFICLADQIEAVKAAFSIRNFFADNLPHIFIFSGRSENWIEAFNQEKTDIPTLKNRHVFLINLFEETIRYLVKSDPEIERLAEMTHNHWREKDDQGNFVRNDEYETLSGHFKQSNRNQILDNYLRTFIVTGRKFSLRERNVPIAFSDHDKETLAIMEHRRWMLEKYSNGWRYGSKRNNDFKIHNNLISWELLTEDEKRKDYTAIDLMIHLINN